MVVKVLSETRALRPAGDVRSLSQRHDVERLRLALAGARAVTFDWTIADDFIVWDGAVDILSLHPDPDRLKLGEAFRGWMNPEGRQKLAAIIETASAGDNTFDLDFEAASAMGSVWFIMRGVRMADSQGRAERLTGSMRVITEEKRSMQRLVYLATRDELTGHLNRNALREELAQAIEAARAETRACAFLVASIDRLAMINDAYGFDAADEVIVAVGERLARSLRGSDIIGRIAGNKLGVILANCSEREIALVADRLRAIVRDQVIDTRSGMVSATISVGAVWLPSGASSSQEAMLRAEEALDRARASGRDGFARLRKVPAARNRAPAPDGDRRRGCGRAQGKPPHLCLSAHHRARSRKSPSITNACCACSSQMARSPLRAISFPRPSSWAWCVLSTATRSK